MHTKSASMTGDQSEVPLLDEANADFIQHHVAINVAACGAGNVPALTRALGCRVSPDRRRITVFVSPARAEGLLQCLHTNGAIAAVFSRPSTHQTLQLKGVDAVAAPLADGDRERIAAYRDSFVEELNKIGHSRAFAAAVISALTDEAVGVGFTPTAAFVATPGPNAGQRLKG